MRLPDFELDTRLYERGSTVVYAGVRVSDSAPVIAKVVAGGRRELQHEYQILGTLAGDGVVEAIGLFDHGDTPVLVQKRFGTGSLAEVIRRAGALPLASALRIGVQLARVLIRMHRARVIHRDIKPANILYDLASETIALADFGIAVELPVDARSIPRQDIVGTPAYVAPEQTGRMAHGCDLRSDLYSFGVTLYELLTGSVPFPDTELVDLIGAHLSRIPDPPDQRVPSIPPVVRAIVMKLLAKQPDERYQSARGVAADLARCLDALDRDGAITGFELGGSDVLHPRFPHKLFGRDAETAVLGQAFARAQAGVPTLVLLTGHDGSGRGELVRAMLRAEASGSASALGSWRTAGERPLSGVSHALADLAGHLVGLEEDDLAALRRRFADRLGQIGQAVLDIAPALGDVFGAQPALAELGPAQAQARLQHAFRCFVAALGDELTLVLALDGFEHADAGSASLIEGLLTSPIRCRALIVLAASDARAFGRLRDHPDAVAIELGAVDADALAACIAETFGCSADRAAELGRVLHDKSGGNPRLFRRWIENLVETGVIERRDGAYAWSLDAVQAAHPPPTLGALAAQRIGQLDDAHIRIVAAVACSDEPLDAAAVAAAVADPAPAVVARLATLAREGLVLSLPGGYRAAHLVIGETALASVGVKQVARIRGRLGAHLLGDGQDGERAPHALRVAMMLRNASAELDAAARVRAARCYVVAGEHVSRAIAYETAADFFAAAGELLGPTGWDDHRGLAFRAELGRARALMMLGGKAEADAVFQAMFSHELSPAEIGPSYVSACDNSNIVLDRDGAIKIGLEGLARLGTRLSPAPSLADGLAATRDNQQRLDSLTARDHLERAEATDEVALAAMGIVFSLSVSTIMAKRTELYVLVMATGLELSLRHGHMANTVSLLCAHAVITRALLGDAAAARVIYEHALALDEARPAANPSANHIVLHWMLGPWFGPWEGRPAKQLVAAHKAIEHGDPVYAAMCGAAWMTMLNLIGTPLDRWAAGLEAQIGLVRGDTGLTTSWPILVGIVGKLTRGEPVLQADLDLVTGIPAAAAPMRNGAIMNLSLALIVCGHEAQVRAWIDDIRERMPAVNFSQPSVMNLWFVDGLLGARAAGYDPVRRREADQALDRLRTLQHNTGANNQDAAVLLIKAELARADGELDRASGLFGRAASTAYARDFNHLVAYALERRADLLDQAGQTYEASIFFREAIAAYRRWAHVTKAVQLEAAHPALRQTAIVRDDPQRPRRARTVARTATIPVMSHTAAHTISDAIDLATVLQVSQEISSQLQASGVVRAVLTGIARNAGAERAVLVLRDPNGVEIVHGELAGEDYRDINVAATEYAELPKSVARVVRRTGRPVVVADAATDPNHGADPFVAANRCCSIAAIPIRRNADVIGFVVLENRLVTGAFTPELVSLTQTLVAQAAISLDNASLYEDMEQRVRERTAALKARNAEMRMVLDHVSQGLVVVGRDGRLFGERSAILAQWFPDGVPDRLAGFFASEPDAAWLFDRGWDQLIEGFMPIEVSLSQLPRQLERAGRIFELDFEPILDDAGEMARLLVVMSDVTEARRRLAAEREQKQLMAIFERLSSDRTGVVEFVEEAAAIVAEIETAAAGREAELRLVHTLKGNAALFGLTTLSALCHDTESALAVEERAMTAAERAALAATWQDLHGKLQRFLDVGDEFLQVRKPDFEAALRLLRRDGNPIAHDLELWKLEPLEVRFQRIAEQAAGLADRLGKGPVQICIAHGGLRIHSDAWAAFWAAFVHAIRNAIDHGLEPAAERTSLGKGPATLTLRSYLEAGALIIELSDDGRGIAWDRLRAKARAAGLPCETERDLVAALLHDGISTHEAVTEVSGRGVGMSAVAAACHAMHGALSVATRAGAGTTWRFAFPGGLARLPRERPVSCELPLTAPALPC